MKTIRPSKAGIKKIGQGELRLGKDDCLDMGRSFIPGEWVQIHDEERGEYHLGFIRSRQTISLVRKSERSLSAEDDEYQVGLQTVLALLERSLSRRRFFGKYFESGRWVYGGSDHLPGLIVDKYENCILIQITTAGIDRFRKNIYEFFKIICPNLDIIIHDDLTLRKDEGLPIHDSPEGHVPGDSGFILVKENGFTLKVARSRFQKSGYYYDHRENRARFEKILCESGGLKEDKEGLDLFCYVGSWGLHQMRAGVGKVTFVDQGNFSEELKDQVSLNGLQGEWQFERSDVWSFLDRSISAGKTYDVISSDPPAFCKSYQEKENAIRGYQKLHQKILKLTKAGGILAINSCTKYVSFLELDKTVQLAARKEGRDLSLISMGLQGLDHPMKSLEDNAHYLKFLAYWVEN